MTLYALSFAPPCWPPASLLGLAASAQTDKAPKTQLWIDLSTGSMAGMPELDMPMGGGLMGMVGGGRPGMGSNTTTAWRAPWASCRRA
jgi:hypothetical protein